MMMNVGERSTTTTQLTSNRSNARLRWVLFWSFLMIAMTAYCLRLDATTASQDRSLFRSSSTKKKFVAKTSASTTGSSSAAAAATAAATAKYPVVDIIAIGSQTRPHYMDIQEQTFGSHPAVRNFFRINELNDTEADCAERLTVEDIDMIADKCHNEVNSWTLLQVVRKKVWDVQKIAKSSSHAVGWKCAQKRPIDALYKVLKEYQNGQHDFPDYLMLMDDDTWINMPVVVNELVTNHPSTDARAIAGCRYRFERKIEKTVPFGIGGFGQFFTKPVLERFTRPIHCGHNAATTVVNDNRDFTANVCARLQENQIGEGPLFQDGMTINDLMYKYTFHHAFVDVASWDTQGGKDGAFYCFHSDHVPSTFVNRYYLSDQVPLVMNDDEKQKTPALRDLPFERTAAYQDSTFQGDLQKGQCLHFGKQACTTASHICHKPTPEHMVWLHTTLLQQRKNDEDENDDDQQS